MAVEEKIDYMDIFDWDEDIFNNDDANSAATETEKNYSQDNSILMFTCKGESFSKEDVGKSSYFNSALDNLIHHENIYKETLSYKNIDSSIPLEDLYQNVHFYCMKMRKCVQQLEEGSKPFCTKRTEGRVPKRSPFELRKEVTDTLLSISFLLSNLKREDDKFLKMILLEIVELFLFLGPVHLLPLNVINASSSRGNKCLSSPHHLLHLHLDARWWILSLLHQIECILVKNGEEELRIQLLCSKENIVDQFKFENAENLSTNGSVIDQCLNMILWDIFILLFRHSSKVSITSMSFGVGFPCSCCFELAISVMHLVQSNFLNKQDFWSLITSMLKVLLLNLKTASALTQFWLETSSTDFVSPPHVFQEAKLRHVWSIFTNIAYLFEYDCQGRLMTSVASEPKMLRTLILLSTSGSVLPTCSTEEELRFYLKCCHSLFLLWRPGEKLRHSDWVSAFWDHFAKHLDSNFLLKGSTLDGFASLSKSPSQFLERIMVISDQCQTQNIAKNENSFAIFLKILVGLVSQNDSECKLMKRRIFLKFHSKKMSELNPVGLYNTTALFLGIAGAADLVNMCNKLCELLSCVAVDHARKLHVVVLGLMTCCLLLTKRKCALNAVVAALDDKVAQVARQCLNSHDLATRRDFGHAVVLYCEGVTEIIEASTDFSLGQNGLFSSNLSHFLNRASSVETKSILSCLDASIKKAKDSQILQSSESNIVGTIWLHFQGALQSLLRNAKVRSPFEVRLLASICCSLCESTTDVSASSDCPLRALVSLVFNGSCADDDLTLQFLTEFLKRSDGISVLSKLYVNYEHQLLACLLPIIVQRGSTEAVINATESVFRTPRLKELMDEPPACPFAVCEMLMQKLQAAFCNAKSFDERIRVRDLSTRAVTPLLRPVATVMRQTPPPQHLTHALMVVAAAFRYAHQVLYIKGKSDCPLVSLISIVVLPSNIYKMEKPLGSVLRDALANVIPKVIWGLQALGPSSDPYVSRSLRDVFITYLHRYPVEAHTFTAVLESERTPNGPQLRCVFIETISINFIAKSSSIAQLQYATSYAAKLLNACPRVWLEASESAFEPLMRRLSLLDETANGAVVTQLLAAIARNAQHSNSQLSQRLSVSLGHFMVSELAWRSWSAWRVASQLAIAEPCLVRRTMGVIREAVEATERKRGNQYDKALRKGYIALMETLGITEADIRIKDL